MTAPWYSAAQILSKKGCIDVSSLLIRRNYRVLCAGVALVLCSSCASLDPHKIDVQLPESLPAQKETTYTATLHNLGLMTEIYDSGLLKIQSNPIGDNTGSSASTGAEIPRDITEMIKSSLNSIGGNVIFIPYDPAFLQNEMVTGYSNFDKKMIPDVIVSGGITEFDRGLVTRGTNTDASIEADVKGLPSALPSNKASLDYGSTAKTGLARITLDFNLLDFKTMSGIPRMNTVNSMEVTKALAEQEFGITLFGPAFGRKGSVKKVQGRHAAVRLLVEISMIQMVGKQLVLPYWRLLGEDAQPDEVVVNALKKSYYRMNEATRLYLAQQWLYLYGYEVTPTGVMDPATLSALKKWKPSFAPTGNGIDEATFSALYFGLPVEEKTLGRRTTLATILQQTPQASEAQVSAPQQPRAQVSPPQAVEPVSATPAPSPAQQRPRKSESKPAEARQSAPPEKPAAQGSVAPSGGRVGRMISDSDW